MRRRGLLGLLVVIVAVVALTSGEDSEDSPPRRADRAGQPPRPPQAPRAARPPKLHRPEPRPPRMHRPEPRPPRPRPSPVPRGAKRSRITESTDGDTVKIAGLGASRLIGVDTPEVFFGAECYGRAASTFTASRLSPGTAVYFKRGVEPTDAYGRALVYLWLPDGTFFNALLVRKGYAVPLTIPPNVEFADRFLRLARRARTAARGLWSPATCGGDADRPAG